MAPTRREREVVRGIHVKKESDLERQGAREELSNKIGASFQAASCLSLPLPVNPNRLTILAPKKAA